MGLIGSCLREPLLVGGFHPIPSVPRNALSLHNSGDLVCHGRLEGGLCRRTRGADIRQRCREAGPQLFQFRERPGVEVCSIASGRCGT